MITLHIPTGQYGFAEISFDGSPEEAIVEAKRLQKLSEGNVGLDTKDFNAILDDLLADYSIEGDPGVIEQMSVDQQQIIQAVKRSIKRLNK